MKYWNQGVVPETKADLSPVTIADKEAEKAIASILTREFPDDGIIGEEGASRPAKSGRRWIVDPIDGTRDFVRGNRSWGVLIALEEDSEVVAGVVHLPAMDEMFSATRGGGAFCNDLPIHVSGVDSIENAVVSVNGFNHLLDYPFASRVLEWVRPFWSVRSFGGCLDAMMIARGQADLWIEPVGQEWDFAPLKVIIEEAGGRFFNFNGGRDIRGGNCVACTPALEQAALNLLRVY
jgi:histidinol phosphatase-like enzyme (inositol monophosphatase family)